MAGLNHSRTPKRPVCGAWPDAGIVCGKKHLSKSALGSYYQVQSANTIVDAVSATIMKQHNPGLTDPQLRQLIAAVHITDDHDQTFWFPLDGWINENGLLSVERSPDSLTGSTDPSGWKPGSAILSW